jgi:D-beta-D-heptose 7-phosphate kinase/D-beta-D-heptose 1-phosphate adenosyltransferase
VKPKNGIIITTNQIPSLVTRYRKNRKSIVLTQGSFDMIHIGHGRYLNKAKTYGDVLFVGVDSDEKVRTRKGPDRPVVPENERLEMLTYLRSVDHVVLKEVNAPKWQLIQLMKPDVLIATESTYTPIQIKELKQWCKRIVVLRSQATTSTSAKLRRLQIGFVQAFSENLTQKVHQAIGDVFAELKQ